MAAKVDPYEVPFTILVDTAETQPWTFQGLLADAKQKFRPLAVNCRLQSLGRYPNSRGDYTIEGLEGKVAVERKSLEDCWSTVMGWGATGQKAGSKTSRRSRFKKELDNLSKLDASVVIVEASLGEVLSKVPSWGVKQDEVNRKIFFRSYISFIQDFKVPWIFCDSRRAAEVAAYRFLARFYEKEKDRGS